MKGSVAARQSGQWLKWFWLLAALTIAIGLALNARAMAGETGSVDEYGGVAVSNSVLLDPFDPVPSIHFRDGGCGWEGCERDCYHRDCGERFRCHDDCRWHGWYCEHGCYDINRPRDGAYNVGWWRCADDCRNGDWWCDHDCRLEGWHCEHDCFIHEPGGRYGRRGPLPPLGDACPDVCYGRLVHEYEEALAHHAEEAHKYDEQSRWYFEHVIDYHPGFFERLFDGHRHDGPPPMPPGPPPPPPGHGLDGYGPPHGPDGHGPDGYGPPGPPHGPDAYGPAPHGPDGYGPGGPHPGGPGYGPSGAPPGGAVYGPGPAAGGYGPAANGYGPPGGAPGAYGPPRNAGGYSLPPGPAPAAYTPTPGSTPTGPPPATGGLPPGATPAKPPPGAVPTTPPPGPGAGDFGPTPH